MNKADWKNYKHLKPSEFNCHCIRCKDKNTGEKKMSKKFMDRLNFSRAYSNTSYDIKNGCGYRCKPHNKEIGGSKTSLHPEGKAGDIPFKNTTKCFKIVYGLILGGFKRIKVYKKSNGSGWIHCDIYEGKKKPVVWFDVVEK
jgi:uncharacterized protein YcbK (DUF882 family)